MRLRSLAVLAFLFCVSTASRAGADSWNLVGPNVDQISDVRFHPTNSQIIYFNAFSGSGWALKRTTDGGATSSVVPVAAYRVLFNPTNPSIIYGYGGYNIYKSIDGGTNWSQLSLSNVGDLVMDPANPNRLFAAGVLPNGVYVSNNAGSTWTPLAAFGTYYAVSAIAVSPNNSNVIYAGTTGDWDIPGQGIFKTTNGGASWTNVANGISNVGSISIDPSNANVVYAATSGSGMYAGNGLKKSVDGGATWPASGFPGASLREVLVDPQHAGRVYAVTNSQLHVSNDNGASWSPVSIPSGTSDIDLFRGDTDQFCLAGGQGVCVTGDAGTSFDQWGTSPADISAVLVDRTDSNVIHATGRGQFRTTNGGGHWDATGAAAFSQRVIQDPSDASVLYNAAYVTDGSVKKSIDGGATWTNSLLGKYINDVGLSPADPSVLYAGGIGILKSVNAGANWTTLSTAYGQTRSIAVDPTDASIVYVGGSTGLIKSVNGGVDWATIHNGLDQPASGWVNDVLIDPGNTAIVYCITRYEGAFRSIDAGANWVRLTASPTTDGRALAFDPEDTAILYGAWYGGGVYVTANAGASWQQLGTAMNSKTDVSVDPGNPDLIYTAGGGAWRYQRTTQVPVPAITSFGPGQVDPSQCNGGCTVTFDVHTNGDFSQISNVGLERRVGDVWIQDDLLQGPLSSADWQLHHTFQLSDPDGDYEFRAVTRSADGARSVSAEATVSLGTATAAGRSPTALSLQQNYPNPFNPTTRIAFSLPHAGPARLAVYTVEGELVAVLADGTSAAGPHEVEWNGRNAAGATVSSGVYFCRLSAAGGTLTRRMVLLK